MSTSQNDDEYADYSMADYADELERQYNESNDIVERVKLAEQIRLIDSFNEHFERTLDDDPFVAVEEENKKSMEGDPIDD